MKKLLLAGVLLALLTGCGARTEAGGTVTLQVFAAASLSAAFTDAGAVFTKTRPGLQVEFNFAGSQQLAQQINSGAPADVFASANIDQMQSAVDGGRIDAESARPFAGNRLVVVTPAGNPGEVETLADLARPGLKVILADSAVPAGQYAAEFLDKAAGDPALGMGFREAVLANVLSYEQDVKAVVAKVQLGEADAGIVYATDAASAEVGSIDIPDALNVTAVYPIAPLNDSPNASAAQAFVDFVLSPDGQAIFAKYGFTPGE